MRMKNERQSRCGRVRDVRNENGNKNKCCGQVVLPWCGEVFGEAAGVFDREERANVIGVVGTTMSSVGDPGMSTDCGTTIAGVAFVCRPLSMVFVGAGCQLTEVPRECCTNGRRRK